MLDPDIESEYSRYPNRLKEVVKERSSELRHVIVDKIQKVPALLDVIQGLMEKYKKIQFVMTGSSARKLKRGAGNLLGGRAFAFHMYPFTSMEAPNSSNLTEMLQWGTLPKIYDFVDPIEKKRFHRSYCQTYLQEEIQLEQIVRNISSFREFLEIASQFANEIINFSNISKQTGVDEKKLLDFLKFSQIPILEYFLNRLTVQ